MLRPIKFPARNIVEQPAGGFGSGLITNADPVRRSLDSVSAVSNLIPLDPPSVRTRPDRVQLGVAFASAVTGLHAYYKSTDVTFAQLLAKAGTAIYKWTGSTWSSIGTGWTSGTHMAGANFGGVALITDGTSVVYQWDGTNFSVLAGSPPVAPYILTAYRRVFLATGYTLYASDLDAAATWSGGDAGSIPVNAQDGDAITWLDYWQGVVMVWKRYSFYVVNGPEYGLLLNNGNWRVQQVAPVGTVNGRTIAKGRTAMHWLSDRGVEEWSGGGPPTLVSAAIQDQIDTINWSAIGTACAWADNKDRYHLEAPTGTATTPNARFVYDPATGAWWQYAGTSHQSAVAFKVASQAVPVFGDSNGGVYYDDSNTSGGNIAWSLTWQWAPSGAHNRVLRRVYVVLAITSGTAQIQTSVDGSTWATALALTANTYLSRQRVQVPINAGDPNRSPVFWLQVSGTGVTTLYDVVPVFEELRD